MPVAPGSSVLQRNTTLNNDYPEVPRRCLVTGGTGFVGMRLVEMLVERGAEEVIAMDIVPIEKLSDEIQKTLWRTDKIKFVKGDISKADDIAPYFENIDCVWHIAAIVGPFHPLSVYYKVNVEGTKNVVESCKKFGVPKIVMASSPSTRMNGTDIDGLLTSKLPTWEEMQGKFLQPYSETKYISEKYCMEQCCDELLTVAVAPHQVYGPRDSLFLPNMLDVMGSNKLRIFNRPGSSEGKNKISMTYVDNYCHGLIIAENALTKDSACKGKFYIVTDGKAHPQEQYAYFWDELEYVGQKMGFSSLKSRFSLPYWLLMPIAFLLNWVFNLFGRRSKISPFTVKMLTMHRWYRIDEAESDLGYQPIVSFREGWDDTADWFKQNWLPAYKARSKSSNIGLFSGITSSTTNKIAMQSKNK